MKKIVVFLGLVLLGACSPQYHVITRPDPTYKVAVINDLTNRLLDVPVTYIGDDGQESHGFVDLKFGTKIVIKTEKR